MKSGATWLVVLWVVAALLEWRLLRGLSVYFIDGPQDVAPPLPLLR